MPRPRAAAGQPACYCCLLCTKEKAGLVLRAEGWTASSSCGALFPSPASCLTTQKSCPLRKVPQGGQAGPGPQWPAVQELCVASLPRLPVPMACCSVGPPVLSTQHWGLSPPTALSPVDPGDQGLMYTEA